MAKEPEAGATPTPSPSSDVGSKVIEVWCGQPHQYHHSLTDQKAPGALSWQTLQETGGHMKINLPIFKDEDTKDVVTYQSWRWDLTVYHCAGC